MFCKQTQEISCKYQIKIFQLIYGSPKSYIIHIISKKYFSQNLILFNQTDENYIFIDIKGN